MEKTEIIKIYQKFTCNESREMTEARFVRAVEEIETNKPSATELIKTLRNFQHTNLKTLGIACIDAAQLIEQLSMSDFEKDEALNTFILNVDNWLKTGIPADAETSKAIYEKAKKCRNKR